ncbi:hypothetical protein RCC89_16410 [Cytophagaceae bacterium ABcell3]|nr:hypothetical protein RCC89_16410 [Cytophagaceae bacterium ABcell3]
MIEIIILFFLARKIGKEASSGGEKPFKWQAFAVLGWFTFEFMGYSLFLSGTGVVDPVSEGMGYLVMMLAFGLGAGYLGFLLVQKMLRKKISAEEGS